MSDDKPDQWVKRSKVMTGLDNKPRDGLLETRHRKIDPENPPIESEVFSSNADYVMQRLSLMENNAKRIAEMHGFESTLQVIKDGTRCYLAGTTAEPQSRLYHAFISEQSCESFRQTIDALSQILTPEQLNTAALALRHLHNAMSAQQRLFIAENERLLSARKPEKGRHTNEERQQAVNKVKTLVSEGEKITKAQSQVGTQYSVSRKTISLWMKKFK